MERNRVISNLSLVTQSYPPFPSQVPSHLFPAMYVNDETILDNVVFYYGNKKWEGKRADVMVRGCKGSVVRIYRRRDGETNITLYMFRPLGTQYLFPVHKGELCVEKDIAGAGSLSFFGRHALKNFLKPPSE